jgi:hypothetical protein
MGVFGDSESGAVLVGFETCHTQGTDGGKGTERERVNGGWS